MWPEWPFSGRLGGYPYPENRAIGLLDLPFAPVIRSPRRERHVQPLANLALGKFNSWQTYPLANLPLGKLNPANSTRQTHIGGVASAATFASVSSAGLAVRTALRHQRATRSRANRRRAA